MGVDRVQAAGASVTVGQPDVATPRAELAEPVGLADWRGDVALELWVETDVLPARVRLAGRLDATTAANLAQVMRELLADGIRDVELCTDGLRVVDSSALGALADIEHLVRSEGGNLVRVAPSSGPFSRTRRTGPPAGPRA
jgi:anti-anti-sigma factor